jgi:hypothetical protein
MGNKKIKANGKGKKVTIKQKIVFNLPPNIAPIQPQIPQTIKEKKAITESLTKWFGTGNAFIELLKKITSFIFLIICICSC